MTTAEHDRLAEGAVGCRGLAPLGHLPQRARMGHRPRGLQRRRRRLELLPVRARSHAAPTAGTRTAWPAGATATRRSAWGWRCGTARTRSSRSAPTDWPTCRATTARTSRTTGSTPTTCRPTRTRRWSTSTRTRAFPYEDLLAVNAARGQDAAASTSCSTRCATTGSRTGTSTSSWSTPRPRPRTCCAGSRSPTAAPTPHRSTCCRSSGTATPGRWEPGEAAAHHEAARRGGAAPTTPALGERWLSVIVVRRVGARAAVLRERDEQRGRSSARRTRRPTAKDGIDDYVVDGDADAVEHARRAARWPRTSRATLQPGESVTVTRPLRAGRPAAAVRRRRRRCSRPGGRRPTSSTATSAAADPDRRPAARPAPGARRTAVVQAVLPLRGAPLARRAIPAQPPPPDVALARPQQRLAALGQSRRDPDAGRLGVPVVRRVGPRLPLRDDGDDRPGLREGAGAAPAVLASPAPARPDPGVRVELRRHQPARARLGGVAGLPARPAREGRRRPDVPRGGLPSHDARRDVVAQPEGRRTTAACSAAASSAWTTSASSTVTSRCPRAARSRRSTARPGWPPSSCRCSR